MGKAIKKQGLTNVTYLGTSYGYSLSECPPVFLVASYRFDEGANIWSEKRTWGWLPSLKHARKAVAMNSGDMYETTFTHVIIEEVPAGICALNKVVDVYKWCPDKTDKNHWRGKWVRCQKPKWMKRTVNFTIG